MNKKFKLLFMFLVVVGVSGFVYASQTSGEFYLEEGWNVVPEDIKAIYILKQPSQEFVRLYPKPEIKKLEGIDDSYYEKTAQFVYSKEAGRMEYSLEEALPLGELELYSGWNFVSITPYMVESLLYPDLLFEEIVGDCAVLQKYLFQDGEWVLFDYPEMDSTLNGKGLVVKVQDDCRLGIVGNPVTTPTNNLIK